MCLDPRKLAKSVPHVSGQRGFSLVSAIFLLIVLAALGAFMVTFSGVQHTTSAQDIQGSRAYQAARAGIEWGVYQVLRVPPPPAAAPGCPASPSTLTLGGTVADFVVLVECTSSVFTEGTDTVRVYSFTSTATQGAPVSTLRVERRLQATVSR